MVPYIAGAIGLAAAGLGWKWYDERLRVGDTALVPFSELRPLSATMADFQSIQSLIPKTGLMNNQVTLTVSAIHRPVAQGRIMAPGGAGSITVEFNVASVVTIQRGSRYLKGGK